MTLVIDIIGNTVAVIIGSSVGLFFGLLAAKFIRSSQREFAALRYNGHVDKDEK